MINLPKLGSPFIVLTKIAAIEIDVTLTEDHNFDSYATENPLEGNTVVTDHVVLLPAVLNITGRVSDASMSIAGIGAKQTANDAYKALVDLQQHREPFEVVTGLHTYTNMILERLSIPRDPKDGQSIRFNAQFRELFIVGSSAKSNRDSVHESVRHSALDVIDLGVVEKVPIL